MLYSCFKILPRKLTTGMYKAEYACGEETTMKLLLSEVDEFQIMSYGTPSETLCGLLQKDTPQTSVFYPMFWLKVGLHLCQVARR